MILGVHHVAIATFDIKRLADFYCQAFDFRLIKTGGWERDSVRHELVTGVKGSAALSWMLQRDNLFLELFEYSEPRGIKLADARLCDPGYTHFCFAVTEIDSEYQRLQSCGMRFHGPPPGQPGDPVRAIYGRDPDGNSIELIEFRPDSEHVYHSKHLPLAAQAG
ncbi:MAG: glyoxalase-like domain protein [Hydrocarboniphaga sp.]|uniref:VOC family protein n=1 Tax=Hydrocarboniphaga sp. TaxID=2033016 RepID=UPI0026086C41|nr:VOC family protein [Hydrocarboniphaga sp.]MDB5970012.1 glyoxalase-like domain protein [Hydrocarboniphaga sp.]